jgi:hypothetical protein
METVKTVITQTAFLLIVVVGALGQAQQNPFGDMPGHLSVPSDNVCGIAVSESSSQPVPKIKLELKPLSYKFPYQHFSIVQMRAGKTIKQSTTGTDGKFDLRGVKPGIYIVRVASSPDGAWGQFEILAPSKIDSCYLRLSIDLDKNTVTLSVPALSVSGALKK